MKDSSPHDQDLVMYSMPQEVYSTRYSEGEYSIQKLDKLENKSIMNVIRAPLPEWHILSHVCRPQFNAFPQTDLHLIIVF